MRKALYILKLFALLLYSICWWCYRRIRGTARYKLPLTHHVEPPRKREHRIKVQERIVFNEETGRDEFKVEV